MPLPRQIVLPVGIDHRMRLGQERPGKMVIDHHRVEAERGGRKQRIMGIDAAIERHQQLDALARQPFDGGAARPIAFGDAIRNMDLRRDPEGPEIEHEQRRRGDAVDIVVGDDADHLARDDGAGQPVGARFEIADRRRLRHEGTQPRAQNVGAAIDRDAASRQHPAENLGDAESLGDGERRPSVPETRAPVAAGQRPPDIEKMPGLRHGRANRRRLRIQRTVPVAERITIVGGDMRAVEPDARQHRSVGDPGGGEHDITGGKLGKLEFMVGVLDPHAPRPLPLLGLLQHQPSLHLSADAAQRRRRQHALRGATDAEIDVDAGILVGGVDDAGDIAVADQPDGPPTLRIASISSAWRGRSRMQAVMSDGDTPLAFASRLMFSPGGRSRSTVPAG